MSEEKPYREGCDDDSEPAKDQGVDLEEDPEEGMEAQPEQPQEGEDEGKGPPEVIPVTSFLVVLHENGNIEAIIGLPVEAFPRKRDATLRDVRDACMALHDDAMVTMIAQGTAETVGRTMAKAAEAQMVQRMRNSMGVGGIRPQ